MPWALPTWHSEGGASGAGEVQGERCIHIPSPCLLVSCPLLQVVTAETLIDPSDLSENDEVPPAQDVSQVPQVRSGFHRPVCVRGAHACCFPGRVSGSRMWTGTVSPIDTPTSSLPPSRTWITSNCTGKGPPRARGGQACLGRCGLESKFNPLCLWTGHLNLVSISSLICRMGSGKGSWATSVLP